jgi:hypothetical protein
MKILEPLIYKEFSYVPSLLSVKYWDGNNLPHKKIFSGMYIVQRILHPMINGIKQTLNEII